MEDKRIHNIKVRLNDEEYEFYKTKMERSGCRTISQFIRNCVINSYIFNIDTSMLIDIKKLVKSISNNINQIALRVNFQGSVYKEDIDEIKSRINDIYKQLNNIEKLLTRYRKLN